MPRCFWCNDDPLYIAYHDQEWGVPQRDPQWLRTGFDVLPVRLEHYSELTFGLRVSNHAGTVAYSRDTGPSPALAEHRAHRSGG